MNIELVLSSSVIALILILFKVLMDKLKPIRIKNDDKK